jgi:predicted transcriptional regulator
MLRIDRAGQVSKRYAGASGSLLAEGPGVCPLWDVFAAFARADVTVADLVETEDGRRWFTLARCVTPQGAGQVQARFAVALGLDAADAGTLSAARGTDLRGRATPVGLGCRACTRADCPQRSAPPAGRALVVGERESGVTPLGFAAD